MKKDKEFVQTRATDSNALLLASQVCTLALSNFLMCTCRKIGLPWGLAVRMCHSTTQVSALSQDSFISVGMSTRLHVTPHIDGLMFNAAAKL